MLSHSSHLIEKKVPGTRNFVASDRTECRELKEAMATLVRESKDLQAIIKKRKVLM
jgi:hypothetical protein